MSIIEIHYDGDIIYDHKVPLRILASTLTHIQQAITQSYLDITKPNGVWKHARMSKSDYEQALFLVGDQREGGFILDFLSSVPLADDIVKRISSAIKPAFQKAQEQGFSNTEGLIQQAEFRKVQLAKDIIRPVNFQNIHMSPGPQIIRKYGDRSIVKDIDQILSNIRSDSSGDSTFELTLNSGITEKFDFNKNISNKFHNVITKKDIGNPLIYRGIIRALDINTLSGKFINSETKKTCMLKLVSKDDILIIRDFLGDQEIKFIGSPLIEYGAYDLEAGDIYFLKLVA